MDSHDKKIDELMYFSNKHKIELINIKNRSINNVLIFDEFTVKYNNIIWFRFSLKTNTDSLKSTIIHNKQKNVINNTDEVENFVLNCKSFIILLRSSLDKVNRKYYILRNLYIDMIVLRVPPGVKNIAYAVILLNMDGSCVIKINRFDMIFYDSIDAAIGCGDLFPLKRTFWNNILNLMHIF